MDLTSFLQAHLESAITVIVSLFALYLTKRSAEASRRSADAAEEANRHSRVSANAADLSTQMTQTGFENEAMRSKAHAYWTLYRIHHIVNVGPQDIDLITSVDLKPIQDFLHIYGHTLLPQDRENIRLTLAKMESIIAHKPVNFDIIRYDTLRPCVRDAANAIREDWMELL